MEGICRICGQTSSGIQFVDWVRPTFTDWDKLQPGTIICADCQFWFEERSKELACLVGKDKLQRMRNYSHFIVDGQWIPLSKGDKIRMAELLLGIPFPELAIVADSGQKHIAFRARRNPPESTSGWVQFEENALFVNPGDLCRLLYQIETLYDGGFAKYEIGSSTYNPYRIQRFGITAWYSIEEQLCHARGSLLFRLALFLAQKGVKRERPRKLASAGSGVADGDLAGHSGGLQVALPDEYLAAVRGSDPQRRVHEQPGEVRQLSLLQAAGNGRAQR